MANQLLFSLLLATSPVVSENSPLPLVMSGHTKSELATLKQNATSEVAELSAERKKKLVDRLPVAEIERKYVFPEGCVDCEAVKSTK